MYRLYQIIKNEEDGRSLLHELDLMLYHRLATLPTSVQLDLVDLFVRVCEYGKAKVEKDVDNLEAELKHLVNVCEDTCRDINDFFETNDTSYKKRVLDAIKYFEGSCVRRDYGRPNPIKR